MVKLVQQLYASVGNVSDRCSVDLLLIPSVHPQWPKSEDTKQQIKCRHLLEHDLEHFTTQAIETATGMSATRIRACAHGEKAKAKWLPLLGAFFERELEQKLVAANPARVASNSHPAALRLGRGVHAEAGSPAPKKRKASPKQTHSHTRLKGKGPEQVSCGVPLACCCGLS